MTAAPIHRPIICDDAERHECDRLAVDDAELARLLCVSKKTVARLGIRGKLPAAIRLGRRKLYVLDGPRGIRRWLELGCPARATFESMTKN